MPTSDIPSLNGHFLARWDVPIQKYAASRLVHQATDSFDAVRPELILGEGNLLPFYFLRVGDRMGRAVVKIRRNDGATGTGFLVAPDILLTNNHVLPDAATAAKARAVGNYEEQPPEGDPGLRSIDVALAPGRLFVTQPELDFTFCGVLGLESLGTIPLTRASLALGPSEVVNIIQHPRGRPKEIAVQDNQVVKANSVVVHYVCDTEPGSSGSPVFDNRWRLVALHHASICTEPEAGGRAARGKDPEMRFLNEGIRLSAIALWLDSAEAEQLENPESITRLRPLFRGLDAEAGYFGALGRSAAGQTAAEIVANSLMRGAEILDIAYWDLGDVAPRLLDQLDMVGQTLATVGMDIWCLPNVSKTALRALADHLDTAFRLEYRDLIGPEGANVGMLVRRTRALEAERLDAHTAKIRVGTLADRLVTFQLSLMPESGPSAIAERIDALGPEIQGDWILIGGSSAWVGSEDLRTLRARGLNLLVADADTDGGLVVLRDSARSAILRGFVSANARSADKTLRVARDRKFPEAAREFIPKHPVAFRLVLGNR